MSGALYAAFDRFPTRKGASVHIAHFAPALFERFGGGLLAVLGDAELPLHQFEKMPWGQVEIVRYAQPDVNFLERALGYSAMLSELLDERGDDLALCHFRDPWGGVPILSRPHRYATVFEVNALPSLELASRHPSLSPRVLEKIHAHERFCLEACDRIVTPSRITARMLEVSGVPAGKISVVPNGARPCDVKPARPADAPQNYLIYIGALQRWQGVDTLLRAFARLADLPELHLVICASAENRDAHRLQALAERLDIDASRLHWRYALEEGELAAWLGHARISLAPLSDCARNTVQGCAPLKILETMAAGVPLIASDLPVVRELVEDGVEGRLVPPDRPAELARAIRILLAYPELADELGRNGALRIERESSWKHSLTALQNAYEELAATRDAPRAVSMVG
ncbi:MAG: glycosyltransferase [Lysobacteraceae bacterium]